MLSEAARRAGRPGRRRPGQRRPGRPGVLRSKVTRRPVDLTELAADLGPAGPPARRRHLLPGRPGHRPAGRAGPGRSLARLRGGPGSTWPWRATSSARCHGCTWRPRALSSAARVACSATTVDDLLRPGADERGPADEPRGWPRPRCSSTTPGWPTGSTERQRDPRLGERAFAARLWYALDTETDPDALLTRAESDLMAIEEEIADVAARIGPRLGLGTGRPATDMVRDVLDALAACAPVTDETVLTAVPAHWLKVDPRRGRRARPGHDVRRPGPGDRDAGVPARGGGGLLRPAGSAPEPFDNGG